MVSAPTTEPVTPQRGGLHRVLVTLCVTETTSWGILYYAFPVLAGRISADTGWSLTRLTAAFSLGLVVSAVLGIGVGRWLDRHGPRWLMTLGSALAAVSVVGVALAPSFGWFVTAWAVSGVAMSAVLYPPAFAALTRWYGDRRVHALTILTLAAGLASTIFAPVTAGLASRLDWRSTYLALAGLLAVVTVPAHGWGLRLAWPPRPPAAVSATAHAHAPRRVLRSRAFLTLVVSFGLTSLTSYVVVVNLVPLLGERGIGPGTAAVVLGVGGVGQVLGRLSHAPLARRLGVRARTLVVLGTVALTTGLLGVLSWLPSLIASAVAAGMVRGIVTLLQATAVTDRWGARDYGTLSGVLAAPLTLTTAVAPFLGAALAVLLGSYAAMLLAMAGVGLAAAALSLGSVPPARPTRPPHP
ncbi:Cyanate permease [Friedmanniella luteola]|uniref:Cyanate permease n=1 Tax=Friedmanniella luteola TaxID=546871 RepID=A0A1H1XMW6_9ACTN|nr:MFS transporter [Friedmanniella luteola]SDT10523.1 Cyanate permease [Friedmanniella luteola]